MDEKELSQSEKIQEGDAEAQYKAGFVEWVFGDKKIATFWYTKAAEQGNADALYNLRVLLSER